MTPLFTRGHESKTKNAGLAEVNLLSLSYGRIVRRDIDSPNGLVPASYETYQIVEPGDIVFRFTDLQNDTTSLRSALVTERGIITSAYVVFRPTEIDPPYLNYLMRSYDTTKVFYGMGAGVRQTLNYHDVRRLPILVPPLTNQHAIAEWLNRETAKIETLVAKQEELIERLRERRTALIEHLTLRGLPGQKMEDSGVPWIGALPSGWEVDKLLRHARIGNGSTPRRENPDYWVGGTIPWLNSSVVNLDRVTGADQLVTEKAFAECHLPMVIQGSVLVGLTGQGKTRGMATLLEVPSTINQHLAYVTPVADYWDSRYLTWLLRAAYAELRRVSEENGSTKGGLTCADLAALRVPIPPLKEQRRIVEYLDEQTEKIETLIAKAEQFIELVKERRAALITDVVTGQIDIGDHGDLEVVA